MPEAFGQELLSGNFSQPKSKVIAFPASDIIRVTDVSGFAAGDIVLLIQMQGVTIIDAPNFYGTLQDTLGSPGLHEFLIIQSVGASEIEFEKNILNSYDVRGNVQVIKAPYYNSAKVTGELTVDEWNPVSGTGGVLTMIVGRSLELAADINVSGKGFRGGNLTIGTADCTPAAYSDEYYGAAYTFAGSKGEGLALHKDAGGYPLLSTYAVKGKGPNYTGGGGGNGKFSGGGGGANKGSGGQGGTMDCFYPFDVGKGGFKADHPSLEGAIFLGGGGGGATASAAGITGPGGNGGGIVIIVADSLIGSGGSIHADGANGTGSTGAAGSGGGGAGGTIALALNGFGLSALTLSVKGGNGGDNAGTFGEGGGGGGGFIYLRKDKTTDLILNEGLPGNYPSSTAFEGTPGKKQLLFAAKLNGFLFNSIRSSVTGDQTDSICSNMVPPVIYGTIPVGGKTPYTYKWEKSYDNFATAPILLAMDGTTVNYTPAAPEANTVWYRRTVIDDLGLADVSKTVKMIVQPAIQNNSIGNDSIICFDQDPGRIRQLVLPTNGNGRYAFNWQVNPDGAGYADPANAHTGKDYTPEPGLEITSMYRRTITSGRCVDSSAIVTITVLPLIQGNEIISPDEEICFGSAFSPLQGSRTAATTPVLSGGDGAYRYQWQYNINNAGWSDAVGVSTVADYADPVENPENAPSNVYLYRRMVRSGTNDVCISTSNIVTLTDFHRLANNIISSAQVICSGEIPALLTGTLPQYGNGTYTYAWQDSSKLHDWTDIPLATGKDFQPPALTDSTRYRRIAYSSDCSDISNSVKIVVHKPILNYGAALLSGGLDSTICSGSVPHKLKGFLPTGGTDLADYTYLWESSTNNVNFSPVASGTSKDYQPVALTQTTWFRRHTSSGNCSVISDTVRIVVLELIANNDISADQSICYNSSALPLTGASLSGGDGSNYTYLWEQSTDNGTTWLAATGASTGATYNSPALTVPTWYRRTVWSGAGNCCMSISDIVKININPLPTAEIRNPADTTICGGLPVLLKMKLTGSAPWTVTYNENSAAGAPVSVSAPDGILSVVPPSPSATNTINYSLKTVTDNNGCVAVSMTGTKKITVYKTPVPDAGEDAVVCGPSVRLQAVPSVGTGTWLLPAEVVSSTANSAIMNITVDSLFQGGSVTHKFYWEELNVQCRKKDSVTVLFNKRIAGINAGSDTSLYSFDNVFGLSNDPPMTWETAAWTVVEGEGNFDDIPGSITNIGPGANIYEWTITNGTCTKSDLLHVSLYSLEIPEGFSPNNDPEGYNNTFVIKGLNLESQVAELKVVNSAGAEVFSTGNSNGQTWSDWDGTNSKGIDLPEGTYYYILKLTSNNNGKVFKKSGFIILKRY